MNLIGLRNNVRTLLQEPEEIKWSDGELDKYINDGLDEISRVSSTKGIVEFNVLSIPPAPIPHIIEISDFINIAQEVLWKPLSTPTVVTPLKRWTDYDKHLSDTTGKPVSYSLENGKIRLYPKPDEAGKLCVRGILKHPPLEEDSDEVEIPAIDNLIVLYAVWQALRNERDGTFVIYRDEYLYKLERFKEYTLRASTQEGKIKKRFYDDYFLSRRKETGE